jgi:hypothetical protein
MRYVHRPRPFAPDATFELMPDARLRVDQGRRQALLPLANVSEMRLALRPRNASSEVFETNLRWSDGVGARFNSLSWKSQMEFERLDRDYRAFALALVAAVRAANPQATIRAGVAPWRYWGVLGAGALILLALVVVLATAATRGDWVVMLVVAALGAYFGWWLQRYRIANRPRVLGREEAIPDTLLPRAAG